MKILYVQPQIIEPLQTIEPTQNDKDQINLPWQTNRRVRFNPEVQRKYIDPEPKYLTYIQVIGESFGENDDFEDLQFLESLYWKAVSANNNRRIYANFRRKKIMEAEIDLKMWRMKNLTGTYFAK
ncbi:30140_t:CDS:2 [Gigaspora margarita]|uniref:30140_t:CDS:1 n=1 Tax=Gigaspora margarita TaxID=4874 RepID=A0ABN7V419_GIGMA|nr:30140_t:CDS:2 [Gigaspora margarita]